MSFWNKVFGGGDAKAAAAEPASHQLPSQMVAKQFGEVNVRKLNGQWEVSMTILMEPQGKDAEGWQTGVAIDASGSMKGVFGVGIDVTRQLPDSLVQSYVQKGLLQFVQHQGQNVPILSDAGERALVQQGYAKWTNNEVEPAARRFTAYLASNLDADGGTTVIYWACGDGSQMEVIGDYTAEQCEAAPFKGPSKAGFGNRTVLTPAVKYFADRFADAKNGMYVFITDGELHDLEDVKRYTIKLCKDIEAKRRNPLKCVLIGMGSSINEDQMEQLDDLDSGTEVDIWDHKIAKDMRTITEIFAELVSENQIVAPTGRILDASGQVARAYTDGLPAKIEFTMPATSDWFELEVGGERIRQSVIIPAGSS